MTRGEKHTVRNNPGERLGGVTVVMTMTERRVSYGGSELRPDDLISAADATSIAGRSVRTIRRAYRAGKLLAYRDGNGHGVRIRYSDLRRWMTAQAVGPVAESEDLAAATARPVRQVNVSGRNAGGVTSDSLALLKAARRRHGGGRGSASGRRAAGSTPSRRA